MSFRWRTKKKAPIAPSASTPAAAPMPMPAFAPELRPGSDDGVALTMESVLEALAASPVPVALGVKLGASVIIPPAVGTLLSVKIFRVTGLVVTPLPVGAHPAVELTSVHIMAFGQQPPPAACAHAKLPVEHRSLVVVTMTRVVTLVGKLPSGVG